MTDEYTYTFQSVDSDHTIVAEFTTEPEPTPTGGTLRMFVKKGGAWSPLFQ